MKHNHLKEYNLAQINEMLTYCEIQIAGYGRSIDQNQACLEWVRLYAAHFKLEWNESHRSY